MPRRLVIAMVAVVIAVTIGGGAYALGKAGAVPVKACSSNTGHRLALLKNGHCGPGFTKVTLGAKGPAGARGPAGPRGLKGETGPQGPGAIWRQVPVSNNDIQATVDANLHGLQITSICGQAANVSITIAPTDGTSKIEMYGTRTQNTGLAVVSLQSVPSFSASASTNAGFDIVTRVAGGDFVDLHVNGVWANNKCTVTEVATPASAPPL